MVYPGSKLKTIAYFEQHLNANVSVYSGCPFLDELNTELKPNIEQISFEYTKKLQKSDGKWVFTLAHALTTGSGTHVGSGVFTQN